MKKILKISLIFGLVGMVSTFYLSGCNSDTISPENEQLKNIKDGFAIEFDDSIIINHTDIDYYDFSTHIIYLKKSNSFLNSYMGYGKFSIYAEREKIYEGSIHPGYSSSSPYQPVIWVAPSSYPDYLIRIDFINMLDSLGNPIREDPRSDIRTINALKKYDQYHEGLSCTIDHALQMTNGKIKFTFTVSNNDASDYFILSPEKMGSGLFHYFTNGLYVCVPGEVWMSHRDQTIQPELWDGWNQGWFDVLRSGSFRAYTITYENFDPVPKGQYDIFFEFPGLSNQVRREELVNRFGRIWLGDINATGRITIN